MNGRTLSLAYTPRITHSSCLRCLVILLKIRTLGGEQFSLKDAVWNLTNDETKEWTAQAFLHVSDDGKSLSSWMHFGAIY